jgi:hypothetical protein
VHLQHSPHNTLSTLLPTRFIITPISPTHPSDTTLAPHTTQSLFTPVSPTHYTQSNLEHQSRTRATYPLSVVGIRKMMTRWPQPSRPIRFTFVRDPLTRFVSAYRELEFRSVSTCALLVQTLVRVEKFSFVLVIATTTSSTPADIPSGFPAPRAANHQLPSTTTTNCYHHHHHHHHLAPPPPQTLTNQHLVTTNH